MTKQKTIKCYRFVNPDLLSQYDKKTKWEIGKWNKVDGEIEPCENGLHASKTPLQSLNNVFGEKWFIAEARGKIAEDDDKFAASEMRIIKEIPVIVIQRFALFCAKSCLKNYEKEYPNDNRVSECVRITEQYLDGKASRKELDAARIAAEIAAESAAGSAAWSAWSAESAAGSAAKSAAWSAESAAKSAARKNQEKELNRLIKEYTK